MREKRALKWVNNGAADAEVEHHPAEGNNFTVIKKKI